MRKSVKGNTNGQLKRYNEKGIAKKQTGVIVMKCKKCGTRFDGNFCPKCGTPAETQSESGSKKKRGKGCLITILVAVVFVVAVSALAGSPDE